MGLHISRIQITNFRNFKELDVSLSEKSVIVGENKSGKTNLIYALRLILDPDLPDSARQLREEDFWDGLDSPLINGEEITISVELQGFDENESLLAILTDYLVDCGETPTAKITYKFAPIQDTSDSEGEDVECKYDFLVYGGDDPANTYGYRQRKWMPLQVLPALRDAETDLEHWRKSPLRPLIDRLKINRESLEPAALQVDYATKKILELEEICSLSNDIENRLKEMVGKFHSVSPNLGIASTDALRLLKSLRLFVDGEKQRSICDASLGICNILYLTLLMLELERKESTGERAATILAIEEPEAHIHPHLQRLVYKDFLKRDSSIILTTHSPHIASVSPIDSIVLLRNCGEEIGSVATSTANLELSKTQTQDLERYIDVTRGEIFFARGAILVEGDAELYIVPAFAEALGISLDQLGITVCSVQGTDFAPYVRLLTKNGLNIPFTVITDGDPINKNNKLEYVGNKRGIVLAKHINSQSSNTFDTLLTSGDWPKIYEQLNQTGVFVGLHTLEIDLALSDNYNEILLNIKEIGAGLTKQQKFKTALDIIKSDYDYNDPLKCDISYIIKTIEGYGKGRFAQRLSSKLSKDKIPDYIKGAIKYIAKTVENCIA